MSKPVITYLKREIKKVLPVLILGIVYVAFIFGIVYLNLRDKYMDAILSFAYSDWFSVDEIGDLFINRLCSYMEEFHLIFIIVFIGILVYRVFYQENRAEISDFLRTLPVKDWQKLWIKVGVGEGVILLVCALFGVTGTVMNAILNPKFQEISSFFPGDHAPAGSYVMLWQIVLMMFLGMSAIFLVLFAAQSIIHNVAVAFCVGSGVLFAPFYFTTVYESVVNDSYIAHSIPLSLLMYYPEYIYGGEAIDVDLSYVGEQPMSMSVTIANAQWEWFSEKLLFLLVLILIALVIITAVAVFRWNIRESSNSIINSKVVTEFIFTGISVAVAAAIVLFNSDGGEDGFQVWLTSGLIAAILLAVANMILYAVQKRRRGA